MSATKPLKIDWRRWRERGQGLVEYAMILAMVAIVILAILTYLGTVVQVSLYSKIGSGMEAIVR
ncbi:MAG: Flp family type IVb pilin [Chloroflexia bacterium]